MYYARSRRNWIMTSKKTISARDPERNIGDELLQAIRDVKSGKYGAK